MSKYQSAIQKSNQGIKKKVKKKRKLATCTVYGRNSGIPEAFK